LSLCEGFLTFCQTPDENKDLIFFIISVLSVAGIFLATPMYQVQPSNGGLLK
jgi:hypothetical protein